MLFAHLVRTNARVGVASAQPAARKSLPLVSRRVVAYSTFSRSGRNDTRSVGKFVLGWSMAMAAGFFAYHSGIGSLPSQTLGLSHLANGSANGSDGNSERDSELDNGLHFRSSDGLPEGTLTSSEGTHYASADELRQAISELKETFPEEGKVLTDQESLVGHSYSPSSYHPTAPHAVVVQALSTEDVVKIVNISRKYRAPIVPYSGATSIEGHFNGVPTGSICLDMSAMNKILEIHEADGDLRCQAGAGWEEINETLKEKGIPLFFPLDPGPGATIGGMISTGCSGTNAVRYGTAKAEWFLNITVVLPNGEVATTRRRARKSSTGFDTTKLFIGAEGTLGIVTEATLRLAPVVPTRVAMAQFPDVQKAVDAVQEILKTPHGPNVQCIELLDDDMMDALNKGGNVENSYPVKDTLFFKLQGSQLGIKETSEVIQSIVRKNGSTHFQFAASEEEAEDLWQNRKYALMATMSTHPGSKCWTTDVCVPVSKLPQLVYETKRDLAKAGLRSTIVGHVGDGNFHALILFDDDKELEKVSDAVHRMVNRAIALDGTCTGEHGVGVGKLEYLDDELGENTVELMRTVKRAIDPLNLFNPGKLYPKKGGHKNH